MHWLRNDGLSSAFVVASWFGGVRSIGTEAGVVIMMEEDGEFIVFCEKRVQMLREHCKA